MTQNLFAAQFIRFMSSGRTCPALCGCESEDGFSAGEYVVKLLGALQHRGSINELIGLKLANHFAICTPVPALILMEEQLLELIALQEPSKADILRRSVGLNFGTKVLVGYSTWPVDKSLLETMRDPAANIFAFDALLQNPDRRHNNPNLLVKGDELAIYDHEIAFSFILDIFPSPTPWLLDRQTYLTEHVFFRQLKGHTIDLDRFTANLKNLSNDALEEMFADVPPEWNNESGPKIRNHLSAVRDHADEFAEQIRRFLA